MAIRRHEEQRAGHGLPQGQLPALLRRDLLEGDLVAQLVHNPQNFPNEILRPGHRDRAGPGIGVDVQGLGLPDHEGRRAEGQAIAIRGAAQPQGFCRRFDVTVLLGGKVIDVQLHPHAERIVSHAPVCRYAGNGFQQSGRGTA